MIGNLLRYMPAKNYQIRPCFDKVIAKYNSAVFLDLHGTITASAAAATTTATTTTIFVLWI